MAELWENLTAERQAEILARAPLFRAAKQRIAPRSDLLSRLQRILRLWRMSETWAQATIHFQQEGAEEVEASVNRMTAAVQRLNSELDREHDKMQRLVKLVERIEEESPGDGQVRAV